MRASLDDPGPQGQSQWEHPALDPSASGSPPLPSDQFAAPAAGAANPKRRQYAAAQAQAYVNGPEAGAAGATLSPSLGVGGPELFTPGYTGQDAAAAPAPYYAPGAGQPAYGQPQPGGQQPGQMAQLAGQFGQMGMGAAGVDLRVSSPSSLLPRPSLLAEALSRRRSAG